MRQNAADRGSLRARTADIKELGRRAYPDPKCAVRRILEALPAEVPVAELTGAIRAMLAVA